MNPETPQPFEPIPGYDDFYHALDGEVAYRNFGGKSLEDAERMFLSHPHGYQEDFMWMGAGSFRFYYPIVDRYLRSITATEQGDDDCAYILSKDIGMHFDCGHVLQAIPAAVIDLCDYVLSHLDNFVCKERDSYAADRAELEQSYRELKQKAVRHVDGVRPSKKRRET